MIRVLVCHHDAIVLRGLREILNEQTGMRVVGEATSHAELFQILSDEPWDIVLLDTSVPGKSCLDVVKQVVASHPTMPVAVLGRKSEPHIASRVIKAGARAFLSTECAPAEIVRGLRTALQGEKYLCCHIAQTLALQALEDSEENINHETLSDRELQVLLMIGSGKTTKEIAHNLSLSEKTVGTYRQRILNKMAMRHNADIIRYVVENKLVDSE